MASITELTQWETGVYQFETTDPIQGGAAGVDNLPHKQIGNRTLFLKARIDAITTQSGQTPSNTDTLQPLSCVVLHAPTIAAIRALPVPQVATTQTVLIIALGTAAAGDNGGGTYRWVYNSTAVDDGLSILKPNSITHPAAGRWLFLVPNPAGLNAGLLNGQAGSFYQNASSLNAGTVPTARLGTGTASESTYLRGDQTWSTVNAVSLNGQAAAFYQNAGNMNAGVLAPARMGSGSPSSTSYLRGDGVWSTVDSATLSGQAASYYLNASNLNAGTVPTVRLGSGTANGSTYLRGDNVWSTVNAASLNGQLASFYTNAGNMSAGILPAARIALSGVSQYAASIKTRNFPNKAGTNVTLLAGSGPPSLSGSVDGDSFEYY